MDTDDQNINKNNQYSEGNVPEYIVNDINITDSTRFKLSVFSSIVLMIVGVMAFIYEPHHIDKFAFYTINMVLPIITYVIGRTVRSGQHSKGLLTNPGMRYRTALLSFLISLLIGIICYIFSPQNIDKLGMYMIGVILPIVGLILGRSFKKSEERIYQHDYNQYDSYQYNSGNVSINTNSGYNPYKPNKNNNSSTTQSTEDDKGVDDYKVDE